MFTAQDLELKDNCSIYQPSIDHNGAVTAETLLFVSKCAFANSSNSVKGKTSIDSGVSNITNYTHTISIYTYPDKAIKKGNIILYKSKKYVVMETSETKDFNEKSLFYHCYLTDTI